MFKKKEKQPQEDDIAPPAPIDSKAPKCTDPAADKSKAKEDVVYPSGLKLALLITSIFVGMFLVSLVR
jgi:hypothetical protein